MDQQSRKTQGRIASLLLLLLLLQRKNYTMRHCPKSPCAQPFPTPWPQWLQTSLLGIRSSAASLHAPR